MTPEERATIDLALSMIDAANKLLKSTHDKGWTTPRAWLTDAAEYIRAFTPADRQEERN